jgi:hypothetical protein
MESREGDLKGRKVRVNRMKEDFVKQTRKGEFVWPRKSS